MRLTHVERLEILRRDTREFWITYQEQCNKYVQPDSNMLVHGKVLHMLGSLSQGAGTIKYSDIVTRLDGRGQEGVDALLTDAKCFMEATRLLNAWLVLLYLVEENDQIKVDPEQLSVPL